jgi:hypothetical protein
VSWYYVVVSTDFLRLINTCRVMLSVVLTSRVGCIEYRYIYSLSRCDVLLLYPLTYWG